MPRIDLEKFQDNMKNVTLSLHDAPQPFIGISPLYSLGIWLKEYKEWYRESREALAPIIEEGNDIQERRKEK